MFSETETAVAAGDGTVAKITLQVAATVAAGDYDIALKGIVMHTPEGTEIAQVENKTFKLTVKEAVGVKGDVNGDGSVDGMDVVAVYNIMLGNADPTPAADVNGDGSVDGMDVVAIYGIMLGN